MTDHTVRTLVRGCINNYHNCRPFQTLLVSPQIFYVLARPSLLYISYFHTCKCLIRMLYISFEHSYNQLTFDKISLHDSYIILCSRLIKTLKKEGI